MELKHKILEVTDIVNTISEYIQLTKKGNRYFGCCPFHNEKTASFCVTPSMQMWHCFGCGKGGNVIDFVMEAEKLSFYDALKLLAQKNNIELPTHKEENNEQRLHREALTNANKLANSFFQNEFEKSERAKQYAESRWGLDFARSIGIGYAPADWNALKNYIKANNYQQKFFEEVGLIHVNQEKKKSFDFFRDRITIPIVSRSGQIIGFTARDISGNPDTPKYLNNPESEIYHKGESIFGINYAAKEAARVDEMYLVEGAPDVLRLESIDVSNAIACLGARWTEQQLRTIQRYTNNVCFIPDGDVLKANQVFPTGIEAVIDNGLKALEIGLNVSVRELTQPNKNVKVDCDSEIKSKTDLLALSKKDFIIWYAEKLNSTATSIDGQKSAIDDVVTALLLINDEVKAELYCTELNQIFGNKGLVKKTYTAALSEHKRNKTIKSRKADVDLLDTYGFWIEDNCYYSANDKGQFKWSNFTLKPLFHIKDVVFPKRLFEITNGRQTEIIELKADDLVSIQKFKQKVEGLGNFIWQVKEEQLTKLKTYLYEQTETAVEIKQLGWNKDGFFAFGNGIHFEGTFYEADDLGIVRLGENQNYYLPAKSSIYASDRTLFEFEKNFSHYGFNNCSLTDAFTKIATVYGDNGIIGITFYMASLFKDLVLKNTSLHFPILNLFGPKGSGKTELAISLKRFFQLKDIQLNLNNTTIAAIANNLAQVANAIVHFDEFRNDLDTKIRESLKGVWDNTGRSRMNLDRDKQVESTLVDCALVLSGQEMATADIALFSRFVFLRFSETSFSIDAKKNFSELSELQRKGFSHITLQLLNMRPHIEREISKTLKEVNSEITNRLGKTIIEDRILGNYEVLLVIYKIISKYITLPFTYNKVFELCYSYMLEQQSNCFKNNELTNFWECVQVLVQNGDLTIESDFRIKNEKVLKTDLVEQEYQTSKLILYIRPSRIFQLYAKQYRALGETCLPRTSLKYYLENSKEYLGQKKNMRFKFIVHGNDVYQTEQTENGTTKTSAAQYDRAMCFDYEAVMNNYNIDINTYSQEDLPE